jgi:phage portal protein BeeE
MTFRRQWQSRADPLMSLDQWAGIFSAFSYNGLMYPYLLHQTALGRQEEIGAGFSGYVYSAYRANGVVFACMLVRLLTFSEARFQFQQMRGGRPGDMFGTPELELLETPWERATTGDLLIRAIQDADLAGNFFCIRTVNQAGDPVIKRLRPDWVTIVAGSPTDPTVRAFDLDAQLLGYVYQPGGMGGTTAAAPAVFLTPDQVCHFAPIPDPLFSFRGMSWLEPVIREVMADGAATSHKLKFFENGATPNMVVSLDPTIGKDMFDSWKETFNSEHLGMINAYKTLFLGGGAKVSVVGKDFQQMEFKTTQGAGETRIAAAAGVPPVIVGLSEGLQAATYSNYQQAMRRFADVTMRPLWRNFCGSIAHIISVPGGSRLWYDDRDIPFLQDDETQMAQVQLTTAQAMTQLIISGYTPDSIVEAITSNDFTRLEHTGLYSMKLQPPGELGEPGGPTSLEALPPSAALQPPATGNGRRPPIPAGAGGPAQEGLP